jgi:two-component system cell cycle sensor histidine kinase/response regulator CckA
MNDSPVEKTRHGPESISRWWWSLFNAAEDAQMVCRADGIAQHINPKAAGLFKLKPDSAGELSIFKLLPPPASLKLERLLQLRSIRTETIPAVTIPQVNVPSLLVDLEIVPLEDGFILVIFKDATRRLRLESHVQRLITAIDATPDVFLVADADLRITYVNPAFQTATGYGIEEVLGRADDFLRAPSEKGKVQAYLDSVSQCREWIGELVNVRSNGQSYRVESTVSPISDIAGRFMGYVACERDLTMREQLQDALRAERDLVRSILQSLDGAIYSLDREFRLTHANEGWRHLPSEHGGIRMGEAPEIGGALLDYVPDHGRRVELQSLFQEVINSGKAQDNYFHDAEGRHWVIKVSPWVNGTDVNGLICNVADQTHYHDLQNQLFQSQKMEIIGTLAAGVAHDFNNLLQVIMGHTSLILMNTPEGPSPLRQGLEKIDMAAGRATEITQQLLSFSRTSEDKNLVLDFNTVITEASQLARRTVRSNVTIELQAAPAPLPVKINSTHASQALLNLCVNAQDAMPEGGRLTITNAAVKLSHDLAARHPHTQPDAVYARCSISDTGGGIHPDLLPRIFQPFFTTKEKGKGTGLGLSIVQRIVREAGGFIDVDTVFGKGTTFQLYLPLSQDKIATGAAPAQGTLSKGSGCVLVVDDVDLVRDLAKELLETSGLTVLTAANGPEALKILEAGTRPVDILFTDYNMPKMNGLDLIEQVATRWPGTKFILASGYLSETARIRAGEHQSHLVLKPYDMFEVSKVITRMLDSK